ncbi:MAG: cupin domain-containing protein [Flavobacteriaceae bacterium]|nr:cupin domain-containing protein [Flavobacteriaceae bacterium]
MVRSKEKSNHYSWGKGCSGWIIVENEDLCIIEESMPPNTEEQWHYHEKAQQFFRVLQGTATFELEGQLLFLHPGEGIAIPPNTKHRIKNDQAVPLEFLVISTPPTRGDRVELV